MVKGENEPLDLSRREPAGLRRIVAASRVAPNRAGLVEHRNCVTARIALRVRVDAEELSDPDFDSRLLGDLASAATLGRFARVAEAARQRPTAPEGRFSASNEKEAAPAVSHPRVHGETGSLRSAHDVRP